MSKNNEEISSNISVLIPDSQDHKLLVLQVVNCFSLYNNVKVYVMSTDKHNYLKYSRYVTHLSYYPDTGLDNWIGHINSQVEEHAIDVILPVFETGIKHLITHKNRIVCKDRLCLLPSLSNFNTAQDKGLLYAHLKANGFSCPESVITKANELPELKTLNFPIIAKPVSGFGGGQQIRVLRTKDDLLRYCNSATFNCNAMYQNFIEGYDLTCNVLCINGEVTAYTIQNSSLFHKDEVTPQRGFEFIADYSLIRHIKDLMKSLNWSGVANVDVRYDKTDDTFKIIEINTRYWMNVDASAIANVNFPYLHCLSSMHVFADTDIKQAYNIRYLNLKGLVQHVVKKPSMIFNIGYLRNNTPIVFALKDPLPMIYKFVWRTKNIIVGKLRN